MAKRYYMAYGSNLNVAQMQVRCPGARPIGSTVLNGYRLKYKGSMTGSYLTIEEAEGYSVPIGVWEVTKSDEKQLDRYEGYPSFYYKKNIKLKFDDGEEAVGFVYIMHEYRKNGVPSQYYVRTCEEGYADFGFDVSVLNEAYEFSKAHVNIA